MKLDRDLAFLRVSCIVVACLQMGGGGLELARREYLPALLLFLIGLSSCTSASWTRTQQRTRDVIREVRRIVESESQS